MSKQLSEMTDAELLEVQRSTRETLHQAKRDMRAVKVEYARRDRRKRAAALAKQAKALEAEAAELAKD